MFGDNSNIAYVSGTEAKTPFDSQTTEMKRWPLTARLQVSYMEVLHY